MHIRVTYRKTYLQISLVNSRVALLLKIQKWNRILLDYPPTIPKKFKINGLEKHITIHKTRNRQNCPRPFKNNKYLVENCKIREYPDLISFQSSSLCVFFLFSVKLQIVFEGNKFVVFIVFILHTVVCCSAINS